MQILLLYHSQHRCIFSHPSVCHCRNHHIEVDCHSYHHLALCSHNHSDTCFQLLVYPRLLHLDSQTCHSNLFTLDLANFLKTLTVSMFPKALPSIFSAFISMSSFVFVVISICAIICFCSSERVTLFQHLFQFIIHTC